MKRTLIPTIIMLLAFTTISAQKIKGNGKIKTETRSVGDYDKVKVNGSFDVILEKGREGEITIKGESNIIPIIEIAVNDGVLKVSTKKGTSFYTRKELLITIPFTDIELVSLNGSGDIDGKDVVKASYLEVNLHGSGDIDLEVDASELKSELHGSGDIELSGKTQELSVKVTGSGDFEGEELQSNITKAKVTGSGDASVVAKQSIDAKVVGSGDIEYKGSPSDKHVSVVGSGSIDRM